MESAKAKKKDKNLEVKRSKKKSKKYKSRRSISSDSYSTSDSDSVGEVQRRSRHTTERKRKRDRGTSVDSIEGRSSKRRRQNKESKKRKKKKDRKLLSKKSSRRQGHKRYRESSVSTTCSSSYYSSDSFSPCSSYSSRDEKVHKRSISRKGHVKRYNSKETESKISSAKTQNPRKGKHQTLEIQAIDSHLVEILSEQLNASKNENLKSSLTNNEVNDSDRQTQQVGNKSEVVELLLRQKALENLINYRRSRVGMTTDAINKPVKTVLSNVQSNSDGQSGLTVVIHKKADQECSVDENGSYKPSHLGVSQIVGDCNNEDLDRFQKVNCADGNKSNQQSNVETASLGMKNVSELDISSNVADSLHTSAQSNMIPPAKESQTDSPERYLPLDAVGSKCLEQDLHPCQGSNTLCRKDDFQELLPNDLQLPAVQEVEEHDNKSIEEDKNASSQSKSEMKTLGPLSNQAGAMFHLTKNVETSRGTESQDTSMEKAAASSAREEAVESFQTKKMFVKRGGELVEVSYRVRIPQRTPSIARRQLKR